MFHGVTDTIMFYRVTLIRTLPLSCSLPSASSFLWLINDKRYSIRSHPFLAKRVFFKSQVNALSEQILSFFVPKMFYLEKKRPFSERGHRAERFCLWTERNEQNSRTNGFTSLLVLNPIHVYSPFFLEFGGFSFLN